MADAERCYHQAADTDPMHIGALNAMGAVLVRQDKIVDGTAWLERAAIVDPSCAKVWANLTAAYVGAYRYDDAEQVAKLALTLEPTSRDALMNLALAQSGRGDIEAACETYERVIQHHPETSQAFGNQIFLRDLMETTPEEALRLRRRWYTHFGLPLKAAQQPHRNTRDASRRLRIGYVSADIRQHSANFVFGPMLTDLDPAGFEVHVYHNAPAASWDDVTAYYRARVPNWRDIAELDDPQAAALIRADAIDILVDLSAHSSGSRLPVFCMKPAPVQVTAWGHAHGTGVDEMDYFFGDQIAVPPEQHQHYTETVLYLPCIVCYAPPARAPQPSPLPMAGLGAVTFGSMNRAEKITDATWTAWAEILRRVPTSRILLKAGSLNRPPMLQRMYRQLTSRGVDRSRIVVAGGSAHFYALEAYHHVDLVLDSFPHGGGVTTLEALYMGVPVVTLLGQRPGGRTSASVLSCLDLAPWIARSVDEYIAIAVEAVSQPEALARLRSQLRGRMEASVLRSKDYIRAVETCYRRMWQRWCGEQAA